MRQSAFELRANRASIFRMRKLFVIFLLVLIPMQLTWAAVAVYCQHDADLTTQHFGHHDHKHADASTDDTDIDKSKLSKGPHGDCGVCQAHSSLAVASDLSFPIYNGMTPLQAHNTDFPPSSLLSRPERPKWARLA